GWSRSRSSYFLAAKVHSPLFNNASASAYILPGGSGFSALAASLVEAQPASRPAAIVKARASRGKALARHCVIARTKAIAPSPRCVVRFCRRFPTCSANQADDHGHTIRHGTRHVPSHRRLKFAPTLAPNCGQALGLTAVAPGAQSTGRAPQERSAA